MSRKPKVKIFQSPKGMHDILPQEQKYWDKVHRLYKEIGSFYGFEQIETPILEDADLFIRGIGAGTDIVEKELYAFKTKGGDWLALRPEGTAPVVRAYLEHLVNQSHPVKLMYFGPVFRHETPQAGRFREHHQIGFEVLGEEDSVIDVQVIQVIFTLLSELGLKNLIIQINSLGDKSSRVKFREVLKNYYRNKVNRLCPNCKGRFKESPMRLLDCKEEECVSLRASAPNLIDYLDEASHDHFKSVLEFLDEVGLPYTLNPYLVRGLDYYNRTVFEIGPEDVEGQQSSLAGGGRFDGLVELLGGKPTPGIGGSVGVERVIFEMQKRDIKVTQSRPKARVFLAQLGDLAKKKILILFEQFRKADIPVTESLGRDSIKAQLRVADRLNADLALIMGQKEALDNTLILREMQSGVQEVVALEKIIDEVKKRLKKIEPRPRALTGD